MAEAVEMQIKVTSTGKQRQHEATDANHTFNLILKLLTNLSKSLASNLNTNISQSLSTYSALPPVS